MKHLLEVIAKALVDQPDKVTVTEKETALQGIADVIRLHDRHRRGECGKTD